MKVEVRRVTSSDGPLFWFFGERKEVEGVELSVTLGGTSKNYWCLKYIHRGVQIQIRSDTKLFKTASKRALFKELCSISSFSIRNSSPKQTLNARAVAKRISVFDDPTVEIQELTAVIKEDFAGQYCALVDLELLCSSQNGSGNISSDTANHSSIVVDNLKNKLMSTTKEFDGVLTMRTENVKVHENRRQLFSSSTSNDAANPFVRQRPLISRTTSDSAAPPAPWESDLSSSSQLFSRKTRTVIHLHQLILFCNSNITWFPYRTVT